MTPQVAVTTTQAVAPQTAPAPTSASTPAVIPFDFSQLLGSGFMSPLNANDSDATAPAPQPSQPKTSSSDTNSQNANLAGAANVTAPQQPAATTQTSATTAQAPATTTTPTAVQSAAALVPALPQTATSSGTNSSGSTQGSQSVPGAATVEARVAAGASTYFSQPNTMLAGLWHHAGPAEAGDATQSGGAQSDPSSSAQAGDGSTDPAADQAKLAGAANAAAQDGHDASDSEGSPHVGDDAAAQAVAAPTTPDATAAALPAPGGDAHQALAATSATTTTTTASTTPTAMPIPVHVLPAAEQVALSMRQATQSGTDRIEIQLKPASLGAIAVKLDVSHDGHISAVISADRSDTLNLLRQDSQGLQQALRDAGLKADNGSLSFNLRGGDPQSYAQSQTPAATAQSYADAAATPAAGQPSTQSYSRRHDGALDIEV